MCLALVDLCVGFVGCCYSFDFGWICRVALFCLAIVLLECFGFLVSVVVASFVCLFALFALTLD